MSRMRESLRYKLFIRCVHLTNTLKRVFLRPPLNWTVKKIFSSWKLCFILTKKYVQNCNSMTCHGKNWASIRKIIIFYGLFYFLHCYLFSYFWKTNILQTNLCKVLPRPLSYEGNYLFSWKTFNLVWVYAFWGLLKSWIIFK